MKNRGNELRIGTSGFQYDHWKTVFYPDDIPKKRWFEYYARCFDTVEINTSFYRLPRAETFDAWREQAPPGFLYTLKFSRYASHIKRLKEPRGPIALFVGRAARLKKQIGPILVQLPPRWRVNTRRLAAFLEFAPRQYRWTIEFRDSSWLCEEVFALLEEHAAALCMHDIIENHPERITTDWVYLRFHGDHYTGSYSAQFLRAQALRVREYLSQGLDVYVYFNNDAHAHAVHNALELKDYVQCV